jgi:UDP-glucose 4-epimerase
MRRTYPKIGKIAFLEEFMPKQRVILVTGASCEWGQRVAAQLISESDAHVIGLDKVNPEKEIKGLDFIQADLRNPLIADLLSGEKVDTICHLAFRETRQSSEDAFDFNVMGTMKLLAACTRANVKKVVIKSSTAVYGACATNSSFLSETHPLKADRSVGELHDLLEIEDFCNGFRRKAPKLKLSVLRFPGILGPTADTSLARYLKLPLIPVLLGFDPRMQIIHESDVTGAIVYAALNEAPGILNVAAEGVLPLLKVIALAGKLPLPIFHPLIYWGKSVLGRVGDRVFDSIPYDLDHLRYDVVGDLTRMRSQFGYSPKYTAEEILHEFAAHLRVSTFKPVIDELKLDEKRLRNTLERRRREEQDKWEAQHKRKPPSQALIMRAGFEENVQAQFEPEAAPTEGPSEDEETGGI